MDVIVRIVTEFSRFWFLLLFVYILFRVVDNSIAEYISRRKMLKTGPGRFFGYLTVTLANNEDNYAKRFGLKWENSIGSSKSNDIQLPGEDLGKNHAIIYITGNIAYISHSGRNAVYINDEPAGKNNALADGDELSLGSVKLRVRLDHGETNETA